MELLEFPVLALLLPTDKTVKDSHGLGEFDTVTTFFEVQETSNFSVCATVTVRGDLTSGVTQEVIGIFRRFKSFLYKHSFLSGGSLHREDWVYNLCSTGIFITSEDAETVQPIQN